jgi:leader peptidase (prepilin peptidase)/N-methyltransferase
MLTVGYVLVGVLGLMMGSFAGAMVWRLRARQLLNDLTAGEPVDKTELKRLKPLATASVKDDRSRCLYCGHPLKWYDLIPLVSWLSTKGNCRYCGRAIGRFEPLIELGMALGFVLLYAMWVPAYGFGLLSIGLLALWLAATVMLVTLFAYDAKWFLLPDVIMFPLIIVAAVIDVLQLKAFHLSPGDVLINVVASVAILGGLYFGLWLISKGQWVGFGDVKLGLALGLLLANWRLAFLTLFLANLIGTLVVVPGLITKKLSRKSQVPFGPLLIAGFFISLLAGPNLVGWYEHASVWLYTLG